MSADYVDFVLDALTDWHRVTSRRMFGGYGLYRGRLMFALIVDDTLYFKADDSTRGDFEQAGCGPFVYHARGKPVALSYWQVPADVFEDADHLGQWAQKAYQVAVRAQALKPGSKARKTTRLQQVDPEDE